MKKIFFMFLTVVATLVLTACNTNALIIYLPNEYITDSVVENFEKETGIKVQIRTFDSNENAITQAKINKYDLIIPSDYAIEQFSKEGMIKELDWSKIDFDKSKFNTNLSKVVNELNGKGFDLLKYSMPYFWGTFGILYDNSKVIVKELVETQGWNVFQNQSLTKMVYDSPRDTFMVGLASNETPILLSNATENDIKNAKDWLIKTKGSNTYIQSDEILDSAVDGNVPFEIAMVYSGDAAYILQETESYSYHVPSHSNVWIDGFVIPNNAQNEDWAYQFINYISRKDVMLENTFGIGYTPVRQDVLEEILVDEEFISDPRIEYAFNFDISSFTYEVYRYNEKLRVWIENAYDEFLLS